MLLLTCNLSYCSYLNVCQEFFRFGLCLVQIFIKILLCGSSNKHKQIVALISEWREIPTIRNVRCSYLLRNHIFSKLAFNFIYKPRLVDVPNYTLIISYICLILKVPEKGTPITTGTDSRITGLAYWCPVVK